MAVYLSGTNNGYQLRVEVNQGSINNTANTSVLSWSISLITTSISFNGIVENGYLNIDGQRVWTAPSRYNFTGMYNRTIPLGSGSKTIAHNADGSRNVSIAAAFSASSGGWGPVGLSISQTMSLTRTQRNAATPTLSVTFVSQTTATIRWNANLPINSVRWKKGSTGTYNYVNVSNATSGSISVGMSAGQTASIYLSVSSIYVSTYTSDATISVKALDSSWLTNVALTPVNGYTDRLRLTYTYHSTNGTGAAATVAIAGRAAVAVSNGHTFTGLSANTQYAITVQLRNNTSGETSGYAVRGRTHATPTVQITATAAANKKSITAVLRNGANATYYQMYYPGLSWTNTTSLTAQVNPGSSVTFYARAVNGNTGVYGPTVSVTGTTSAANRITGASASSVTRNSMTITATTSLATTKVQITIVGKTSKEIVLSSRQSFSHNFTGLNSNTSYSVNISAYDVAMGGWGPSSSFTFKTQAFKHPNEVSMTAIDFQSMKSTLKINDSARVTLKINGITVINNVRYTSGSTVSHTESGITPDTPVNAVFSYVDEHSSTSGTKQGSLRTMAQDKIQSVYANKDIVDNSNDTSITVAMNTAKWSSIEYELFYTGHSASPTLIHLRTQQVLAPTKTYTFGLTKEQIDQILNDNPTQREIVFTVRTRSLTGSTKAKTFEEYVYKAKISSDTLKVPTIPQVAYTPFYRDLVDPSPITMKVLGTTLNQIVLNMDVKKPLGGYITRVTATIGSNASRQQGVTTEIYRGSAQTTAPSSHTFGPYSNTQMASNYLYITIEDSRGFTKQSAVKQFALVKYNSPSLTIGSLSRENYFGRTVILHNLSLTWTNDARLENDLGDGVLVDFSSSNGTPHTLIPSSEIVSGNYRRSDVVINSLIFEPESSYKIKVFVADKFNRSSYIELVVPAGQALFFPDQTNFQIGVGTTNPMALLDVRGDFVSNNTMYFLPEDLEDL